MSHITLIGPAEEIRNAAGQIANEFIRKFSPSDGYESDRLRPRAPFELAVRVVELCSHAIAAREIPASETGFASRGARVALEGLPAGSSVEWLRTLERSITERFLDCTDVDMADARVGMRRLGALFDELCSQELDAYHSTADELSGWYSRVGTDLLTCLASGAPIEAHTVNSQARILSIDPHQPFRALTLHHEPAPSPQQWSKVRRRLSEALRRLEPQRHLLVRERAGSLLALVAIEGRGTEIVELLAKLLQDMELGRSLFAATGEPAESLAAAGRSCRQALSALEIGVYRGQRGKVTQCTEVILEVLLAHNNWVSHRIVNSRLEPLMDRPHLLDTLRAYINCDMSLQRTAEELIVHPNTVAYRIRQIATLTDRDMRSVTDLADLHVALSALDVVEMRKDMDQGRADLRSRLLN